MPHLTIREAEILVHLSNVLLLVSYSVRDMLWLRCFAVAAALIEFPYYAAQPTILWPPILWGLVFTAVNLYQIARLLLQRRPVVLSEEEQRLYDLGFHSLRPREFLALVLAGQWKDAAMGEQPLIEGQSVTSLSIATAGELAIQKHGKAVAVVPSGHLIGTTIALSGHPSPITASFTAPGRYIRWPLSSLRTFLERRPELRAALQQLINRDLSEKLETVLLRLQ